ncbi:pumilio homolog 3 [Strongylocentrotus purpuratus]|uniref:PUM-HD domain-containing protein n=1 Tax=Strongylocentrotus purpuratus TaxID=7668 RepID=A0A7M7PIZ0_STRPU|nr:pumilio homolog 3 [Strongylocentrotus purpuratus]|eukprot:XP_788454.2 PREDICTED: pumilio domain-containing protein KIAA0020 homolog [Strongylocentrotus purpuratus]
MTEKGNTQVGKKSPKRKHSEMDSSTGDAKSKIKKVKKMDSSTGDAKKANKMGKVKGEMLSPDQKTKLKKEIHAPNGKDKLSKVSSKPRFSAKKPAPKSKENFTKKSGQKGGKPFPKQGHFKQDKQTKPWKEGQKGKEGGDEAEKTKRPKLEELKKKERKQVRKQMNSNFELAQKAKNAWEVVRKHNCKPETRTKHITELCDLLDGRVLDLVKAHDTVRVIQCCVQFGTPEQRTKIFEEVKDHIVELTKCKYAKFYVLKMFRYGSKEQRLAIMRSFHGKVCQLVRHKEAAEVLEEAYNNHANAQERSALMEEFYGARFAVFKSTGIHTLDEILQKDPSLRQGIMDHMLKTLTPLLDKTVIKHTIVHKAIYDFLLHATEKMRAELIEAMREVVVQILHTQDGARAAMHCLWYGTAKDRKVIIKSFKTFVQKICKEEFGHRALFALFDCVDDTKIVSKVILEEMMKAAYEVATDQYGRKVLLYLLVPRDPSHFHPDIVKQLQRGDDNPVSKKESAVRRKELLEAASPALLKLLITHTKEMAYSKSNSQLALALLQHIEGDKSAVYSMLATLAAEELVPILVNDPGKMDEMHIVEHPSGHLMFKRLLAHEKAEREKGDVSSSLSDCLLEELSDENIRSWLRINRGAFVLVSLVECGNDAARKRICTVLQESRKNVDKLTSKGVQVLKEKLDL